MRRTGCLFAAVSVCLASPSTFGHELWFQPNQQDVASVRLTFGDTPASGEAERVAEIARTKVWADGKPLEVTRLPDGLEAKLPARRPAVLSAFADRGIVDYRGDSFVIFLAAYAQTKPVRSEDIRHLGLGDDQVRFLLISREGGPPVVQTVWKGKPVADAVVEIFHVRGEKPAEVRTDSQGEILCPDLKAGPVSLLVVVMDKTPEKRDGRNYTHTRYKATLTLGSDALREPARPSPEECLARVREFHGAAGPWAVAGYRMGVRALKELGLPRHSFELLVIHRCPAELQYSCVADGLQAATGASPGKLNLRVEEATARDLRTVVEDRRSGRCLTFRLRPEFMATFHDLPSGRIELEGRWVFGLPDDSIFIVTESPTVPK